MSKGKVIDPYEIDVDEIDKIEKENKKRSSGLVCPKMNVSIGKPCKVCEYIQSIYARQYPKNHPARNYASDKKAKASIFMNVVFPENPNKSFIFKIGSKAGSAIIDGIKNKGWKDITHPLKGKGREMLISKTKGDSGFNAYPVSPNLDKADWEIPKEVLDNLPNLDQDNLIKMIENGELDNTNFFDVSSLKMDETLEFRICPPWTNGAMGSNNKRPFTYVWRHWGVSQAQIDGTEPMNWKESVEEESSDDSSNDEAKPAKSDTPPWEDSVEVQVDKSVKKKPVCFGREKFFDSEDSEICQNCNFFKSCAKAIANK